MSFNRSIRAALLAGALSLLLPGAGLSGDRKEQDQVREALQRGTILPLSRILSIASKRAPGSVIKIELEDDGGKLIYGIKILGTEGQVRKLKIDAHDGSILREKSEDPD
jgi:uncharacterized membrane protein YkoI